MTHEIIRHLLDDYVTGDLAEEAAAPVAEHVAACEICRNEVESLRQILARARDLPKSIEPPTDAWEGIRSVITRDSAAIADISARPDATRYWQKPAAIAAGLLMIAALSSGGTYLYVRNHQLEGRTTATNTANAPPATLDAFMIEENNYLRTASILQDVLDQQEGALAPETVAQLKASLRTIDEAILEARNALARDPANKMLVEMLSASYRHKVDLLRRTTEMTRGT